MSVMTTEPTRGAVSGTGSSSQAARADIRRLTDRGLIAGVCAGLAQRLEIDAVIVRLAFVASALLGGLGLVVYLLAWVLIPTASVDAVTAARLRTRRANRQVTVGAGLLVLSVLLLLRALGLWFGDAIVWPAVVAIVGALLIWQESVKFPGLGTERQRASAGHSHGPAVVNQPPNGASSQQAPALADAVAWSRSVTSVVRWTGFGTPVLGRRALGKIGFGVSLVVGASLLFLWTNGALTKIGNAVLTVVVVLVALLLILAPLWWRLIKSLAAERAERMRSQQHTAVAAHLHDSVLQTLALIQRRAEDPGAVATLARHQERELRDWLSDRGRTQTGSSVARALQDAAVEIEASHGARVEVVIVGGDCPLDERGQAIVAAAREAILNAAKHGENSPVTVYAELAPGRLAIFVRDRGPGFDPASVPADRHGLRDSIMGRMTHYAGTATVRSTPGTGTEVQLSIKRQRKA
jgi:phage shock protein PspC (stress-responsive transcriptional regulator)/anti-sigma regulatory factor (Ser/Thr protein kinase)